MITQYITPIRNSTSIGSAFQFQIPPDILGTLRTQRKEFRILNDKLALRRPL